LLLGLTIPYCIHAFTLPRNTFSLPLFSRHEFVPITLKSQDSLVVQYAKFDEEEGDSLLLRSIDQKIEKFNNKRTVFLEKLSKYDAELNTLKQKRQEYIAAVQVGKRPDVKATFSETSLRSAVKALAWRVIAGSITFVTSLQFSKSISTALSIVASDFGSKALTMFIGERLMNKSQAGRKSGSDNMSRSLMKALIWRLFAICNTLTLSLIFAKDIKIASKIAGSDTIFKTFLMFAYERMWAKIEWGKKYSLDSIDFII